MAEKLSADECRVLSKVRDYDAYWTSDIAYDARMRTTGAARSVLDRLLKQGLVEKVVVGAAGKPSSWRRNSAGRAALALTSKDETNG